MTCMQYEINSSHTVSFSLMEISQWFLMAVILIAIGFFLGIKYKERKFLAPTIII